MPVSDADMLHEYANQRRREKNLAERTASSSSPFQEYSRERRRELAAEAASIGASRESGVSMREYAKERRKEREEREKEEEKQRERGSSGFVFPWDEPGFGKVKAAPVAAASHKGEEVGKEESITEYARRRREEVSGRPPGYTPAPPIPCGGTCAMGKQMMERAAEPVSQPARAEPTPSWLSFSPTTVTEGGTRLEPVEEKSWFEAQSQKVEEWTQEVAKKEEEKKKKELKVPELPWVRELKEQEEILRKAAKQGPVLPLSLPWVETQKAVREAVAESREFLEHQDHEKYRQVEEGELTQEQAEELSPEQEEVLDNLLEKIADIYKEKYEPMREELRKLGKKELEPKEFQYIGERFQDNYEPEQELTAEGELEAKQLAQRLWAKHNHDWDKATDELLALKDRLDIDKNTYDVTWDAIEEWHDAEFKAKERARVSRPERQLMDLAEELMKKNDGDDLAARDDLEEKKDLSEDEKSAVEDFINELEGEKLQKVQNELMRKYKDRDSMAADLWERDDLTDDQKNEFVEMFEQGIESDVSEIFEEEYEKLPLSQQWEKVRADKKLHPIIREALQEQIELEMKQKGLLHPQRRGELSAAGVLKYETHDERRAAIDAIPGLTRDDREYFYALLEEEEKVEREERDAAKKEQEEKERKKRADELLGRGEFYEKRPGGYVLHIKPKKPD